MSDPPPRMRFLLRWAPLALLAGLAAAAYAGGLPRLLSPHSLAAHRAAWAAQAAAHPLASVAGYVLLYATLTAAGLPIALVLTLAGGLIFGALLGGAATLAAVVLSATAAYFAARSAAAPWLAARMQRQTRLAGFVQALRDNGFSLILMARLAPFLPFAAVNLACGLAAAPFRSYAAATLLGALPASFLYASLGAGLGGSLSENSIGQAASRPTIILPLLGLSLLSGAPALFRLWSSRRAPR